MRIKIRDWEDNFERDRSKQWKALRWVPIPNKQGAGYRKIMKSKNGLEVFACWISLVQVASTCYPRGDLSKYDLEALSDLTMIDSKKLSDAITFLSQDIDWIEVIEDYDKNVKECQNRVSLPAVSSSILSSSILSSSILSSSKEKFDIFRKKYPGTKRGLKTEYDNFVKKHKDSADILPLLLPALDNQIKWRGEMSDANMFIPQWKNMATWINNRCWEDEKPEIKIHVDKKRPKKNEFEQTNNDIPMMEL